MGKKSRVTAAPQPVEVDITSVAWVLTLTPPTEAGPAKARATATVKFDATTAGFPVLDLWVEDDKTLAATLDGVAVATIRKPLVKGEPGSEVRVVQQTVAAGSSYTLVYTYDLPVTEASCVRWVDGKGFDVFTQFSDVDIDAGPQVLWPCGAIGDQYALTVTLHVPDHGGQYTLFVNATPYFHPAVSGAVKIVFPADFRAMDHYLHLVPEKVTPHPPNGYIEVDGNRIPTFVYGPEAEKVAKVLPELVADLATRFGPYPHPVLIVLTGVAEGMEYAGALKADRHSLKHELIHQWVGRGLRPADPDALWFDEAVATALGNPERLKMLWNRNPKLSLAVRQPDKWTRHTPRQAYQAGALVVASLNRGNLLSAIQLAATTDYGKGVGAIPGDQVFKLLLGVQKSERVMQLAAGTGTQRAKALSSFSSLRGLGKAERQSGGGADQIWIGTVAFHDSNGALVLLAHRAQVNNTTVREYWAMADDHRLAEYPGTTTWNAEVVGQASSPKLFEDFKIAARYYFACAYAYDTLPTLQFASHTVTDEADASPTMGTCNDWAAHKALKKYDWEDP
ncbi:MAG: hypothetical protein ABMB14_07480 [Myxococcota bacterium]